MTVRKKRVLIVDDDEEILEFTELAFREHGYEVLVARDGAEALTRAERDAPDLIVLDIIMPRRSGFSVLERLCRGPNGLPRIIVVTADEDERRQEVAKSKGADAYIRKPFDVDRLLEKAAELL